MAECKYYSFYALAKINDPELLYEAFQQQIAPGHADKIEVEVFEHLDSRWNRLTPGGNLDQNIASEILQTLKAKYEGEESINWFYEASQSAWYCSYRPLTTKHFVLVVKSSSKDFLIEEDYLQFLFHFYCHQLQMLQGTYRDALTGLYNRRAFNEKVLQLLESSSSHKRRAINFLPSIFVMLDIDHFKQINDSKGHLYGDEVLLLLSQAMMESFRENDLLFRYGGEEFAMVLMDITDEQATQSLQRFREKIANYSFPQSDRVTVSIGFTTFDKRLSMDEIISQADSALYYCKSTSRNAVHCYHHLVDEGLIPEIKPLADCTVDIS
ncbi:MAG: diguanylate cyclase (GGDEF)-like protein [Planctomycetota bacterium]|jgi:diguanylate cyclase (GGDEF)-like protein